MSAHTVNRDLGYALGSNAVLIDPGTLGTLSLGGRQFPVLKNPGAGTYRLPNIPDDLLGTVVFVLADGGITITDSAGSPATIGTLAANETGMFIAQSNTSNVTAWTGVILAASAAVEINTASDLPFADTSSKFSGNSTNVALALMDLKASLGPLAITAVANTTVGAGTLTAASMITQGITRSGSVAAYTDTTATAAQIVTALGTGVPADSIVSWVLLIRNTVSFAETITGGTGVTVSGLSVVPPNSTGVFLMSIDVTSAAATMIGIGAIPQTFLENGKFSTVSTATSATAGIGELTSARHTFYEYTTDGAFALTTRTATEMFGDMPGAYIGLTFFLTILNRGNNTVTLTAGSGVTISGEATVATLVTRTWLCRFTSASAMTITSLTKGTIET